MLLGDTTVEEEEVRVRKKPTKPLAKVNIFYAYCKCYSQSSICISARIF